MERGKRIETQLPEAMIQHLQSYLSGKEAARTTVLSKSWFDAWLTRPSLVFDQRDFKNRDRRSSTVEFTEFARKTMKRYGYLNRKIESFTLQTQSCTRSIDLLASKLIVDAIKMGATDLNLEFRSSTFVLPPEVFGSGSLLRLSVKGCEIDGNVSCSMLKSLKLDSVGLNRDDDMIRDIISCCVSIEELSLSNCSCNYKSGMLALSGENLYEHRKLKRLYLEMVFVGFSFLGNFKSRFPCLKDLSLVGCRCWTAIWIASTSLQRIRIVQSGVLNAYFDVPNLAYFSYSGVDMPSFYIEAREWETCISIDCHHSLTSSWHQSLKKFLTLLGPSKISLSLRWSRNIDIAGGIQVLSEPVVLENLTIEARFGLRCDVLCNWVQFELKGRLCINLVIDNLFIYCFFSYLP